MLQLIAYYEGKVQGVGFRATTCLIAKNLGLMGSVRNLADGRVELIAQGTHEQIDELLSEVRAEFSREIAHVDFEVVAVETLLSSFIIV